MTHGALHVSAIALGVAAFVSISPLSTASADSSAPSGATPSLSEPAPTPSLAMAPQRPSHVYVGHYARHTHYAWRHAHRYAYYDRNPVAATATGVVGGLADLGSMAAYPIYCFPRYGSCPIYQPYP